MAVQTFTKMAIARGQTVTPALVSSVATTNISTFLAGFPASNLEYGDDAWTMMKTGSVSGQPIITHTFFAAPEAKVLGILNHNIGSAGYNSVAVEYFNGSIWVATASMSVPVGAGGTPDSPIWVAWQTAGETATQWRFKLGSGAAGNFYIGGVFYGNAVNEFQKNPLIMNQTMTETLIVETAAGGSKHVAFGADVRNQIMEITFSRLSEVDADKLWRLKKQELVGILTPEHSDATTLIAGQEVFWGYVLRRTVTPRGPGSSMSAQGSHYDITLQLEGAV
jgi:hypothetical protein